MNELDQRMRERIDEDFRARKQERFERVFGSLVNGVFMFLIVNGLGFLTHRYKFAGTRELVLLPVSFVFFVGSSYALGEWRHRRLQRKKEEDL
jgi:hypothetical protein